MIKDPVKLCRGGFAESPELLFDNLYDWNKMSDIDKVYDKINSVSDSVSYLVGRIDATLPHLATKDDLEREIAEHERKCRHIRPSLMPKNGFNAKVYTGIGTGIAALAGAIYALIEILK